MTGPCPACGKWSWREGAAAMTEARLVTARQDLVDQHIFEMHRGVNTCSKGPRCFDAMVEMAARWLLAETAAAPAEPILPQSSNTTPWADLPAAAPAEGLREAQIALDRMIPILAQMVRGHAVCDKGHRKGNGEHYHFETVHEWARLLNADRAAVRAALARHESAGSE